MGHPMGRVLGSGRAAGGARITPRETLLMAVCVLAVLGAGLWGLARRDDSAGPAAGVAGVVEVPGGLLRVEAVVPYDPGKLHSGMQQTSGSAAMPGMAPPMDPDPVAAGKRRFSVRVGLTATESQGVRLSASSFTVSGGGVAPTPPRSDQLGISLVPQGASTSGELTFEVPASARSLSLAFVGGREALPLELPEAPQPAPPTK
ncbi:MAG TPA: hypothetical protein VFJ94_03555 [Intrasporangium sp.]|uniref:hypothetical protein n=1 Tax=Intrasporangium sp. TaxID=1925024 RepID=UPI002D77ADDF|nr:hypothetical protein [Intrasporangium sp.]HET7397578.1 hypothetical protein [Intrasporangium sp.]